MKTNYAATWHFSLLSFLVLGVSSSELRFLEPAETCDIAPVEGVCLPSCYCIPDDCTTCPPLGNRQFAALQFPGFPEVPADLPGFVSSSDVAFFAGLGVDETSLFTFDPPGCQPFPPLAEIFGQPLCDGVKSRSQTNKSQKSGEVQCSFGYKSSKKGDDSCTSNTYAIVEEPVVKSRKKHKKSKGTTTLVTHEGSCGVCSSAQDLAANLSPTNLIDSIGCTDSILPTLADDLPGALPTLSACYVGLGYSPDCAFLKASGALNFGLELVRVGLSLASQGTIPYNGPASCIECAVQCPTISENEEVCNAPYQAGSCELSNCLACDLAVNEEIFNAFSGRTLARSGIVDSTLPSDAVFFGYKVPCSSIADIAQPIPTCPGNDD